MSFNKLSAVIKHNLKDKNTNTREQYQRDAEKFVNFIRERSGSERINPNEYKSAVQEYANHLRDRGISPDTAHTYLAGVTQGLKLSLDEIDHERRTRPQKGRERSFERSHDKKDIGRSIGVRRAELARLRGRDLIERDNRLYILVEKGKGGKRQEQLILPQHEKAVREVFRGKDRDEYIFSRDEVKSLTHSNQHAARRELAQEAYEYYKNLDRVEKDKLLEVCHERFLHKYDKQYKNAPEKARERGERLWKREMQMIERSPKRECRGANKEHLRAEGREVAFDREAVLLVSVLNLAHFREDVTVDNYLV